jgi:hypothetical protein
VGYNLNAQEWHPKLSIYSRQGRLCPLVGLIFFWCFSHNVVSERANAVLSSAPSDEHRLVRGGRSVALIEKAFDTLYVLLEQHGKLVPRT